MNAPCKDCKERHELCHAQCERYKQYSDERQRICEERLAQSRTAAYFKGGYRDHCR